MVQVNTWEVKPLNSAFIIITTYHLSKRHLLAQAISGFIGIDRQVCRRRLPVLLAFWPLLLLRWRGWGLSLLFFWHAWTNLLIVLHAIIGVFPVLRTIFLPSWTLSTRFVNWSRGLVSSPIRTRRTGREHRSRDRCHSYGCYGTGDAAHRHGALRCVLAGLEKLTLPFELPTAILHHFHHLACDLDLLISEFFCADQRALDAVKQTPPLHRIWFLSVLFISLVQFIEDLCKINASGLM